MLLDLGRNDVGRVAEIGSVEVTEQFKIPSTTAHVMHIVSHVDRAAGGLTRMRSDRRWLRGFPAGTVSGAPKVRAMEIIDELEVGETAWHLCRRVSAISAPTAIIDTCIALRTGVIADGQAVMYVQAGGWCRRRQRPAKRSWRRCIAKGARPGAGRRRGHPLRRAALTSGHGPARWLVWRQDREQGAVDAAADRQL